MKNRLKIGATPRFIKAVTKLGSPPRLKPEERPDHTVANLLELLETKPLA